MECRTLVESPGEPNVVGAWQALLMDAARLEDEASRPGGPSSLKPDGSGSASAAPASDGFDHAWEEGVNALLERDLPRALEAFLRAGAIRPGDRRVEANLSRLRELGVGLERTPA